MTSTSSSSSFQEALKALYSPLHQAITKEALEQSAMRREQTIHDMKTYMNRVQLTTETFSKIIHITGTKGKGSTASFCESILRIAYNQRTGLFTSPHLVDIRERIRVNGQPISETVFGDVYWQVRRRLEAFSSQGNTTTDDPSLPILPGYFRMLTLMALFCFQHYESGLDAIVLEVGMGGRYDATNIIDMSPGRAVACGVTLLDLDHTRILGSTLEDIAKEKGGIFQRVKGTCHPPTNTEPSTTEHSHQFFAIDSNTDSVLSVLKECAKQEGLGVLKIISKGDVLSDDVPLGLAGPHQRINAELALALCQSVMGDTSTTDEIIHKALQYTSWPGRCQTIHLEGGLHLFLDGAHTPLSLEACIHWYQSLEHKGTQQILIFNCSHERNPVPLLQQLSCIPFQHVYFCKADFERPSGVGKPRARTLLADAAGMNGGGHVVENHDTAAADDSADDGAVTTWQETLSEIWSVWNDGVLTSTTGLSVEEVLAQIRSDDGAVTAEAVHVLVAGSLYIVGSALDAVQWKEESADGCVTFTPC